MGQFTGKPSQINPYCRLQQHFIWTPSECLEKAGLDTQERKAAQIFLKTLET